MTKIALNLYECNWLVHHLYLVNVDKSKPFIVYHSWTERAEPLRILECIAKQIMTTASQILMEIVYSVPYMSESKIYAKRG